MSKRFGKKRVPECKCTHNFTCRACLDAAGPTPGQAKQLCAWFALCDRDAVTTVHHSVLGDVPCCQRCADFARG